MSTDQHAFLRVGATKLTIASGETLSATRALFEFPVKYLRIAVIDGDEAGLPATPTVTIRVGAHQAPIQLSGASANPLQAVMPTGLWVWAIELPCPLNDFEIQLSAITTADVKFQVSGYGSANV